MRCRPIKNARLALIGWIDDAGRAMRRPAARAPGQRRLLGHRDQARAGARAGRLSGVHAQGHDRSLLYGLRQKAPRCARSAFSAIRDPQRADRRRRDRGGRRRRRISSSSGCMAWARRSMRRFWASCPMPPAASMRRSAATAICSPIWCGGCWKMAPIPRSWPPLRDPNVPIEEILRRPQSRVGNPREARNPTNPVAARSLSAGTA